MWGIVGVGVLEDGRGEVGCRFWEGMAGCDIYNDVTKGPYLKQKRTCHGSALNILCFSVGSF